MFSATGTILAGTEYRPDYYTISQGNQSVSTIDNINVTLLNDLGMLPVVSTFTGCGRYLLGLIHTIVHLSCAIFDGINREHHLEEAKLGAINVARGVVEMVPVVGNLAVLIVDAVRVAKYKNQLENYFIEDADTYKQNDHFIILGCGKMIVSYGYEEGQKRFEEEALKDGSAREFVESLRNVS